MGRMINAAGYQLHGKPSSARIAYPPPAFESEQKGAAMIPWFMLMAVLPGSPVLADYDAFAQSAAAARPAVYSPAARWTSGRGST